MVMTRTRGDALEIRVSGRYKDLMQGKIDVADLDLEELARCQLRDKDGHFRGKPPKYLPADLVKRMRREFYARGDKIFEDSYVDAVQTMVAIMKHSEDDGIRLKAAQYIIERLTGKTPTPVILNVDAPWMGMLQKMIVPVASIEESDDDIEDADIVEEEPAPRRRR